MYYLITLYKDSYNMEPFNSEDKAVEWFDRMTKRHSDVSKAAFLYGPQGLIRSNVELQLDNNFRSPFTFKD